MNNNKEERPSNIATNGIGQILDHKRDTRPCDRFRLIFGPANAASRSVSWLLTGRALLPG